MKVPQAVLEVQTALTEPGAAAAQYIKDNPELGDHPKVAFMEINPISTDCQLRRDSFINGLKSNLAQHRDGVRRQREGVRRGGHQDDRLRQPASRLQRVLLPAVPTSRSAASRH